LDSLIFLSSYENRCEETLTGTKIFSELDALICLFTPESTNEIVKRIILSEILFWT